jgi:6,7-dimethyl-8-ribityllumazine synthase
MQNVKKTERSINAKGKKIGIVVSRFNEGVTGELLESARKGALEFGIAAKDIIVVSVAGAVEIPYA